MTKPRTTEPAADDAEARSTLAVFLGDLAAWLSANSQGLAFFADAPARGWEHMECEHPVGAMLFDAATIPPLQMLTDHAKATVSVGFVFPSRGPAVVAGEYLQRFMEAFGEYLARLGNAPQLELKHVASSTKRDAFVVHAALRVQRVAQEKTVAPNETEGAL